MTTNQVLHIPFRSRGFDGAIVVEVVESTDISETGLDALLVDVPRERLVGYPIMTANVEYAGAGYNAVFAWIQFVEMTPADGSSSTAFLDNMPSLNKQVPFSSLGYLPTLFDAPANPHAPDLEWRAHSFLVRHSLFEPREITPIAAFQWGYDLRDGKPNLVPAVPLPEHDLLRWTISMKESLSGWEMNSTPDSE